MPVNEHEVFEHLTSSKDTSVEIDFLSYAIFAYQKREWIRHFETSHQGAAPTQADIDHWISNLTDLNFREMQESAVNVFDGAARAYLADELEAAKQDALRSVIVREVKSAGAWYKQLAMALLMAILTPLILGGILAAGYFYSLIPTPADFAKRFESSAPTQSEHH